MWMRKRIGFVAIVVISMLVSACDLVPTISADEAPAPQPGDADGAVPTPDPKTPDPTPSRPAPALDGETAADYDGNLARIKAASVRNRTTDRSAFRDTPQAQVPEAELTGPPTGYPDGNGRFPDEGVGAFRIDCEFSHFAYDDPIVKPNQPGASHLHMFFGNTDVNAFTTPETLRDSGGGTCNGHELNRTGYWVPALFDDAGSVRVPDFARVYYKGFRNTDSRAGQVQPYPENMQIVSNNAVNKDRRDGGFAFRCIDTFGGSKSGESATMSNCSGGTNADTGRNMLEMNVKFDQCWNGQDPANYTENLTEPRYSWYSSICPDSHPQLLPNLEFLVRYMLDDGESTEDWYLSSDVGPATGQRGGPSGGTTSHGDWWGAWDPEINEEWIDNCVRPLDTDCGFGLLNDQGTKALTIRDEYDGPNKVDAKALFADLCPTDRDVSRVEMTAHCDPPVADAASGSATFGNATASPPDLGREFVTPLGGGRPVDRESFSCVLL